MACAPANHLLSSRLPALFLAATLFAGINPSTLLAKELVIKPEQIKQLNIQLTDIHKATKSIVTTLPATIIAPINTRVAVTAPFAGTVLRVHGLPGQPIRQGEALVTLASRDLSESIVRLKQAEADLQIAEVLALRQRELFQKNLVMANRVAEAEAQVAKVRSAVRESQRLLTMGNIQINADGSYALTASKDGRIVEIRASPGMALQAMDAAAVIDTSRELWLQAQLPANLIGKVIVGDKIELPWNDDGKVISIGITLDPVTRSTSLLAEIPFNAEHIAGQTTTITIVRPSSEKEFEISTSAISWIGGASYVFARTEGGFSPLPITIKGRTEDIATVEADLRPGQQFAVNGLTQLEKMMSGD